MLKIASAQYEFKNHNSLKEYQTYIENWVKEAANAKARLLLFPEYGSLELVSLMTPELQKDLAGQLNEMQKYREMFFELYQRLAKDYQVYIVAPSFPWKTDNATFVNRSYIFFPNGKKDFQEKLVMTRFEDEDWKISCPEKKELKIFPVDEFQVGISICFDVEFPDFSRELALKGATLILAPSCTETMAGMNRVHVGARARALENQCYVVVSQTIGDVTYSEAIDKNTGLAAVYGPPDVGFPEDGVVAQGSLNKTQWLYAELSVKAVTEVRTQGRVLNYQKMKQLTCLKN